MLKIYGNPFSTCTRKVLMTLAETEQPYELTVVDLAKGEHKGETHLRHQPFGRVPALDDEGFELFESRAMSRYLNERGKGKLLPSDAKARAKVEQWISIETSEFSGHAMKFVYEHVMKRPQEAAVLDTARSALEKTLSVMDAQLGRTPYLTGDEFTLADICYMPYIEYLMATPVKETFAKYPNVSTWWNRISERPTWKKAIGRA